MDQQSEEDQLPQEDIANKLDDLPPEQYLDMIRRGELKLISMRMKNLRFEGIHPGALEDPNIGSHHLSLPLDLPPMDSDFVYPPLRENSFRLLRVLGSGQMAMCQLESFPFDSPPKYVAISYAWGRAPTTKTIFCSAGFGNLDVSSYQTFAVSSHVLDAINNLCWLKLATDHDDAGVRATNYWIDGLCIDQRNDIEKADQVMKMQNIYSRADEVLVWLGPMENDSDFAISNINIAIESAQAWGEYFRNYPGATARISQTIDPGPRMWDAVFHLFSRPWFERTWTIQEFLLAKHVTFVCGGFFLDENSLANLASGIVLGNWILFKTQTGEAKKRFKLNIQAFLNWTGRRKGGQLTSGLPAGDLYGLILNSRFTGVTLPVDRIWAFLGLAEPRLRKALLPFVNYEEQHNHRLAYVNFVRALLPFDKTLQILSGASPQKPGKREDILPSWVPDFNDRRESLVRVAPALDFYAGRYLDPDSSETAFEQAKISFPRATTSLHIYGLIIDFVSQVVDIWPHEECGSDEVLAAKKICEWEDTCLQLARKTWGESERTEEIPDAHWRTLAMNHIQGTPLTQDEFVYYQMFRELYRTPLAARPSFWKKIPHQIMKANLISFEETVRSNIDCNHYFATKEGRVGLASRVAIGDAICVFPGTKVPHLVRFSWTRAPFTLNSRRVTGLLIGDAYVHGLMYGKEFADRLSKGAKLERIILE